MVRPFLAELGDASGVSDASGASEGNEVRDLSSVEVEGVLRTDECLRDLTRIVLDLSLVVEAVEDDALERVCGKDPFSSMMPVSYRSRSSILEGKKRKDPKDNKNGGKGTSLWVNI